MCVLARKRTSAAASERAALECKKSSQSEGQDKASEGEK